MGEVTQVPNRRFVVAAREQALPRFDGRLVKSLGDGMLLEFRTVPQAVGAALHLLIALWRRRGGSGSGPRAGSPLAAG